MNGLTDAQSQGCIDMSNIRELKPGEATKNFLVGLVFAVLVVVGMCVMAYMSNVNNRPKEAAEMLMVVQLDADQPYSKDFLSIAEAAFLDDEITSKEFNLLFQAYHEFEENKRLAAVASLKEPLKHKDD